MARLRIHGLLSPDNQLRLRPAYSSEPGQQARAVIRAFGDAYAEARDAGGRVLARSPLRLLPLSESPKRIVKGLVELHPDAATLVIALRDSSGGAPIELGHYPLPADAPELSIVRQPEAVAAGRQRLAWEARGTPAPVEYLVDYTWDGGRSWQPLSQRLSVAECEVDFDQLPGGEDCRIAVSASSGFRSSTVVGDPFRVAMKPCRALIVHPVAGQSIAPDATLAGNGYWLEEARVELRQLRWLSSIDGELGQGNALAVRLSPGAHEITLIAGSEERQGRHSVNVVVGQGG